VLHFGGVERDLHAVLVFLVVGLLHVGAGFKVKLKVHSGFSAMIFHSQASTLATIQQIEKLVDKV
jgi:hypothetical protein